MILGQPRSVEEYLPLHPTEFDGLRRNLQTAIEQATPPDQPIQMDLGSLCRLCSTVMAMSRELMKHAPPPMLDAGGRPVVDIPPAQKADCQDEGGQS